MTTNNETILIIKAYEEWMKKSSNNPNVDMYLITMMFKHLGGIGRDIALNIIRKEVEVFAGALLKRLYRNPNSSLLVDRGYAIIFFPDLPVQKSDITAKKIIINSPRVNDGIHIHGTAIIPKVSRLKGQTLIDHVKSKYRSYCPLNGKIEEIDIKMITEAEKTTAYAAKHLYRGSFEIDDIIIVPRARSEI